MIPDQIYFDVEDVRTADDALISIKLMIFYHLSNIEKMLDGTHDPVTDLINNVTADIVDFVGARSFQKFKTEAEQLNKLDSYQQLLKSTEKIGYQVGKVVYRGYLASPKLQAMHNNAIETRTNLELKAEMEMQEQDLEDMRQKRLHERLARERKEKEESSKQLLDLRAAEHEEKLRIERREHEEVLAKEAARHEVHRLQEKALREAELAHERQREAIKFEALKRLHDEVQLDITSYLVAQYQHPDKVLKIIAESQQQQSPPPQIHLHTN